MFDFFVLEHFFQFLFLIGLGISLIGYIIGYFLKDSSIILNLTLLIVSILIVKIKYYNENF